GGGATVGSGRAGSARRAQVMAAGVALGAMLILGWLGWLLPMPGGSIVKPTAVVLGIGFGVTFVGALVVYLVRPAGGVTFVLAMAAVTAVTTLWTWALVLPAQMAWDSGAGAVAQAALRRVETGP